ncbi:MAG: hypothetical protein BRC27_00115 [Nanohaloarchaea archaeon SW_10_44_10]|nr:MAG: hypothetical protein BRC27_00115 [Nanohaloarchaea archaeon SW_10_44_10]
MIVGFNVDSLNAEKNRSTKGGDVQVNYTPKIISVEKASINAFDDEVAKIDFSFTVGYTVGDQNAAKIVLEGNILWNRDVEDVVDSWDENEELPEQINKHIMNDLYRKCISQSVGVADTLGLIPPVPTPRIEE